MKKVIYVVFLVTIFGACSDNYKDLEDGLYADLETDKGTIIMKLYPEQVPLTVANFVTLAEGTNSMVPDSIKGKRYFDGLGFHRVIPDFIAQGGDPAGTGSGPLPGYKFRNEFNPDLRHDSKGVVSMANGGGTATNGSQFFITYKPTPWLDGYTNTGDLKDCSKPRTSCHSVFGKVVQGLEVLDSIVKLDVIKKVTIIRKGAKAKEFDAVKVFETEIARGPEIEKARIAKIQGAEKARYDKFIEKKGVFEAKMDVAKAKKTNSGLKVIIYKKGKGKKFSRSATVSIAYSVYLADGTLIQTKEASNPYAFVMDKSPMIAGVTEAILQMREGGKKRLFIPYYLAYGEKGGRMPPKADLVFDLELVKVGK
ncbi:MAG: peptidylprolyl isomerase [Flavobacteriaceae bacterium]|nr:peptidylprolyl isomerase [Flavobacteriaceae bacterium]